MAAAQADESGALSRQYLPDAAELHEDDSMADPFDEKQLASIPGMVHRFPDRLLLVVTHACAIRCRHCTRKGSLHALPLFDPARDSDALRDYLAVHPGIREVILSGGDPLLLEDADIARFIDLLASIPQIEVVRIGTRVPVALPMRITPALCQLLCRFPSLWVNTHFNHPAEVTADAVEACARLVDAGIPVSNQTVLLQGINDSADTLIDLCAVLQRHRIRPYYVFLCDPVAGIAHFRVSRKYAIELASAVRQALGGLAVPLFVEDEPGAPCKRPLM
jgi:lysine 2,3-aminomutase